MQATLQNTRGALLPSRSSLQSHQRCASQKPIASMRAAACLRMSTQKSVSQRSRASSLGRSSKVACRAEMGQPSAVSDAAGSITVPKGEVWELDFCSRPLVDEKGKKVWELLICNPERTFEYSQYFPNNLVNSAELRKAIVAVLEQEGAEMPDKVLYFRGQMQTIITRALNDVNVKIVPSRRCFTIVNWLQERLETVYSQDERYNVAAQPPYTLELGAPSELPDALRGEQWAFVEFPLGALLEESKTVDAGKAFGSTFSMEAAGCADMDMDTLIPGVAVFSRRAKPLAAWTNSLELASITADSDRACLILETGVNTRWRYGSYRRSKETTAESTAWEEAKKGRRGLHFLAVQSDPEADNCDGFWMLQEREPPRI